MENILEFILSEVGNYNYDNSLPVEERTTNVIVSRKIFYEIDKYFKNLFDNKANIDLYFEKGVIKSYYNPAFGNIVFNKNTDMKFIGYQIKNK